METVGSMVSFAVFGMSIMITITANPSFLFPATLRDWAASSWVTQATGNSFSGFMLTYPTQKPLDALGVPIEKNSLISHLPSLSEQKEILYQTCCSSQTLKTKETNKIYST